VLRLLALTVRCKARIKTYPAIKIANVEEVCIDRKEQKEEQENQRGRCIDRSVRIGEWDGNDGTGRRACDDPSLRSPKDILS
jgi:hypothetical protein